MTSPRYLSLVLDVDSTLCGIEGVDWLAARRDPATATDCARLTASAMAGAIQLESIFARRLDRIRPGAEDLAGLAEAYRGALASGAADAVHQIRAAGVEVHLVSGGLRQAILPVSRDLGFDEAEVHAVPVILDPSGNYLDFDRSSPLWRAEGKRDVVHALGLPVPRLAVGDGISDAALRDVVESFAVFTGFVRRQPVVELAQHECTSFTDILDLVLP
ncbi:MAG TPA: haloacid dehalogenase-like hydrolase [Gemmatimonadales bacterium]